MFGFDFLKIFSSSLIYGFKLKLTVGFIYEYYSCTLLCSYYIEISFRSLHSPVTVFSVVVTPTGT